MIGPTLKNIRTYFTALGSALPSVSSIKHGQFTIKQALSTFDEVWMVLRNASGTLVNERVITKTYGDTIYSGKLTVSEGGVVTDATVTTLDFDASDFTLTEAPEDTVSVVLAYGTSAGTPAEGNHTHASTLILQEGGATVDATVGTINFDASDFNLTESPEDTVTVALAYGTGAGTPAEGNHTHVGGGSTIIVQEGGVEVDPGVTTLNFDASDFTVTESPEDTVTLGLAYGTGAGTPAEGNHLHDSTYVNVTGDTMTGGLIIDVTDDNALVVRLADDTNALIVDTNGTKTVRVLNGTSVIGYSDNAVTSNYTHSATTGTHNLFNGGDIDVYSDNGVTQKFFVDGATGNTTVAGTLGVTGRTTLTGNTIATTAGAGITTGVGTIYRASAINEGGFFTTRILIDLTGLNSSTTLDEIAGVNAAASCHIGQYTAAVSGATILSGYMKCLEVPAGGVTDIDLWSANESTGSEDTLITALTGEVQLINSAAAWTISLERCWTAFPTANQYLYLTSGVAGTSATYTAGKFLIEFHGYT
jgi:hypothetical protein